MRALVFEGPGLIAVRDRPEPEIVDDGDAIVRIDAAGLCGSDLHPYLGREPMARGTIPGHEAVGVVEAVGPAVEAISVGRRVIVPFTTSCGRCEPCRRGLSARCELGALFGWRNPADDAHGLDGCQAEVVRVPLADSTLVPAPDIDDRAALLLADNLPTAFAAIDRARAPDSLTVVGLGAVGLSVVAVVRRIGVPRVVAIDPVTERTAAAMALGAEIGVPGAMERTSAVVEASGTPSAQRTAVDCVAPGGVVSIISVQTASNFAFTPIEAYDHNLTVAFGRAPVRSILESHLELLAEVAADVADVIVSSPDLPLSDGPAVYAAFADRRFLKGAFDPAR
jgi:threonine dehydrogenase-like Zn-dependent dehydrogenase